VQFLFSFHFLDEKSLSLSFDLWNYLLDFLALLFHRNWNLFFKIISFSHLSLSDSILIASSHFFFLADQISDIDLFILNLSIEIINIWTETFNLDTQVVVSPNQVFFSLRFRLILQFPMCLKALSVNLNVLSFLSPGLSFELRLFHQTVVFKLNVLESSSNRLDLWSLHHAELILLRS